MISKCLLFRAQLNREALLGQEGPICKVVPTQGRKDSSATALQAPPKTSGRWGEGLSSPLPILPVEPKQRSTASTGRWKAPHIRCGHWGWHPRRGSFAGKKLPAGASLIPGLVRQPGGLGLQPWTSHPRPGKALAALLTYSLSLHYERDICRWGWHVVQLSLICLGQGIEDESFHLYFHFCYHGLWVDKKTCTSKTESHGIILVGHAGLLGNWEWTRGELPACLIDPRSQSMDSTERWPRHHQDLGSDPGSTH